MPFLHDHKRHVPPQNVYRCILIGIHVVPAMATDKSRLVLTTFFRLRSRIPNRSAMCSEPIPCKGIRPVPPICS